MKDRDPQIDGRRDFFKTIALASAYFYLPSILTGCKNSSNSFQSSSQIPFKVWEELIEALKTSPDHLVGRMESLIKQGDLKAMYHFVKNEIILIPPNQFNSQNGLGEKMKFGISGALRCGMATPREKAEILNNMFNDAGIESKIVYEKTNFNTSDVEKIYLNPIERKFEPTISKSQLNQWQREIGAEYDNNEIDLPYTIDYSKDAETLASQLETLVDASTIKLFDFRWNNNSTPTIEFKDNGTTKFAHLFMPSVQFGNLSDANNKTGKARPALENDEKVKLNLTFRDNVYPDKEQSILNGVWPVNELIGNQLNISFLHDLTLDEQTFTTIDQVNTFVPSIAFQDLKQTPEYLSDRSLIGERITLEGKIINLSEGHYADLANEAINQQSDASKLSQVTQLRVEPTITNQPKVKLNIYGLDDNQNTVEGLLARDFKITVDNMPVRALMETNQQMPNILVMVDDSLSMPLEYRNEKMDAFVNKLEQSILANFPKVKLTYWKTSSHLYEWLLKGSKSEVDLMLFITDGDQSDKFNESNLSLYQSGPAALILDVKGNSNSQKTFNHLAEITNGKVADARDQNGVLKFVDQHLNEMDFAPYVFSYVPKCNGKEQTVQVSIDKNRVQSVAKYSCPPQTDQSKNGIIGLYLEVQVGNQKKIKRTLAGWDTIYAFDPDKSQSFTQDVKCLMHGGTLMSIEGGGPTMSMAMTDLLKTKLTNKKWMEAEMNEDYDTAQEELGKGVHNLPGGLLPLISPLQNLATKESLTYPAGYSMCLIKTKMGIDRDTELSFDYLPTANYTTIAKTKEETLSNSLKTTGQLALRERFFYNENTFTALENANIAERHTVDQREWLESHGIEYSHEDRLFWGDRIFRGNGFYHIFDLDANSKAYWQINKTTGEIYGMLPDGSGGGRTKIPDNAEGHSNVMDLFMIMLNIINHVSSLFPAAGGAILGPTAMVSLGVVAKYGVTLVKLYTIVSEAILIMDTSNMRKEIKKALQELANNIGKEVGYGFGKNPGAMMAGLDYLISNMVSTKKKDKKKP